MTNDRPRLLGLPVIWALFVVSPVLGEADELEEMLAAKAGALEVLHRKAERALVAVAQDTSYRDYFVAHSHDHQHRLKERIDEISLETQDKFHVGEMCLIDENGHEISRIVEGEIAHDLSTDEAQAIFFQPGFALAPFEVYVSPIYMSPDVSRWVVAYVTPIKVGDENKAILHYEHDLTVYQGLLVDGLRGSDQVLLAVNQDGWIVADSRREIPTAQPGGSEAPEDYFERFALGGRTLDDLLGGDGTGGGTVMLEQASGRIAWRTVEHWTLVAFEAEGS